MRALLAILQIIKNPWLLNKVLDDDNFWKGKVVKKYPRSIGLPVVEITDLLKDADARVEPYAFLEGGSLVTDLWLLRGLAKKINAKTYLEIGTWRGESVANVAPMVEEAFTINLPDDEMLKMGLTPNYVASHRCFSNYLPNVTHLQADSRTFDFLSLNKKFDLVFVDGGHDYESVLSDTKSILQVIDLQNSIVVWHDYGRNPEIVRWEVLAAILDGMPEELHQHLYQVSNTLCAIYYPGLKEFGGLSFPLEPFGLPTKYFEVSVKCRQIPKVNN